MKTNRGYIVAIHKPTNKIVTISLEMWDLIENTDDYKPLYRADDKKDADNYVKEISTNIQEEPNMVDKQEFIDKACDVLNSMLYMRDCIYYKCVSSSQHATIEEFINEFKKLMEEGNKPETKPIIIEDNKPCINYRNQESGWTCSIYAVRCDGISCKKDCDWYNKSSLYKSK